jgi:hypothetical protein
VHAPTADPRRGGTTATSSSRLRGSVAALVALDLAGGLVAVADGVSPVRDAWGSRALLAAPWPMIAGQVALTALATGRRPAVARGAAALLALACGVSGVSGFLDGGLAAPGLARRHVVLQVVLVAWTVLTGAVAVDHAARLARAERVRARPRASAGCGSATR